LGNIRGLLKQYSLPLRKVRPIAEQVVREIFPTVLQVVPVEDENEPIVFEWVHPEDRKSMYDNAFAWYQYSQTRVGGKHVRCGWVGYWIQTRIEHEVAARLKGDVKVWDESDNVHTKANPEKYKDLWKWFQLHAYDDWTTTVQSIRRSVALNLCLGKYESWGPRKPQGLPSSEFDSIPEWAKEPHDSPNLPPVEQWYRDLA